MEVHISQGLSCLEDLRSLFYVFLTSPYMLHNPSISLSFFLINLIIHSRNVLSMQLLAMQLTVLPVCLQDNKHNSVSE